MKTTQLEQQMIYNLEAHKIEGWVREYHYHPTTKQRFDFAWPDIMLAVECEGGIYPFKCKKTGKLIMRGGHTSIRGFLEDCDKYNTAASMGWTVLRFANPHIMSGKCVDTIKLCVELLKRRIK